MTVSDETKNRTPAFSEVQDDEERLASLLKGMRVAMLTTVGADGALHSRPMVAQECEFDGRLWFFTKIDSGKVHEIANDQHVNVAYADADRDLFVSVSGRAYRSDDSAKRRQLWTSSLEAWFPHGVNDSDLTLLCVEVESADAWEKPGKFTQLLGMAKAVFKGDVYRPQSGEKLNIEPNWTET